MTPHICHCPARLLQSPHLPRVITQAYIPFGILARMTLLVLSLESDFSFVLCLSLQADSSPDSWDHVFSHFVFSTQPHSSNVFYTLAAPTTFFFLLLFYKLDYFNALIPKAIYQKSQHDCMSLPLLFNYFLL